MTIIELKHHARPAGGAPLWISGYREPGDGGEGFFQWMPNMTRESDGGHWIAAPQGGGGWMRVASPAEVNVRHFGARGDGKTDDAPAFRNAIKACRAGSRMVIPPGEYAFGSRVVFDVLDLEIDGGGTIVPFGDYSDYLIEFGRPDRAVAGPYEGSNIYQGRYRVQRLTVRGRDRCRGIFLAHIDQATFDNITIEGTRGAAMRLHNCRHNVFRNVFISRCRGQGEPMLDLFQMSKQPDPYGGCWQGAPGLVDRNVYNTFYSLKIEICDAETYLDIGTEDPASPYISQNTGDNHFIGCIFHGLVRDYLQPDWEGVYRMNLGFRKVPWNIYDYKGPKNIRMVRIRNATGTQFSQCHFTFGSTGGVLIEAGEPGRPAIHTRMIACGFGLGSRPLEDVNITDNRAIKLENVDEFHVWATQLWATDSPGYQKQWVCGVDASKLYINGVRGGASDCIGIESGP